MKTRHFFLFISFLLFFVAACKKPEKEYKPPKVYTIQPLRITTTRALFRATYIKGSDKITLFGFEWRKISDTIYNKKNVQGNNLDFSFMANNLDEDTKYTLRSFIANEDSIWYSNEFSFFTKGTLTDIDGNVYLTLRYGDKVWMTENLRVTRFANGNPIEGRMKGKNSDMDGPVYYYNDSHSPFFSHPLNLGLLYNWAAAAKAPDCNTTIPQNPFFPIPIQGICPKGWHLPHTNEWWELIKCNGNSAVSLKSENWPEYPTEANDYSQFSIEPAGCYAWADGGFSNIGEAALFWTSSNGENQAINMQIVSGMSSIGSFNNYKSEGYSVRCVKD